MWCQKEKENGFGTLNETKDSASLPDIKNKWEEGLGLCVKHAAMSLGLLGCMFHTKSQTLLPFNACGVSEVEDSNRAGTRAEDPNQPAAAAGVVLQEGQY